MTLNLMNRDAVLHSNPFTRAVRKRVPIKLALVGMPGTGKTYTALTIAQAIGGKVALIDSERGSASLYAGQFDFDAVEIDGDHHPDKYINALLAAQAHGYDIVIIDSLSHPWSGDGGILTLVDKLGSGNNKFAGWRKATPIHHALVDAILDADIHVFATLRGKPLAGEKDIDPIFAMLGIQPDQRDGILHEFDVAGVMDHSNALHIAKSRVDKLDNLDIIAPPAYDAKGARVTTYDKLAARLKTWANEGADPALYFWQNEDEVRSFLEGALAVFGAPNESLGEFSKRALAALQGDHPDAQRFSDLAGVVSRADAQRVLEQAAEDAASKAAADAAHDDTPPLVDAEPSAPDLEQMGY